MNTKIIENKLTYFVGTFILAVAFLFPAMAFAATITVPGDEATVADAIATSSAGDTILLTANIVTTEQITINKAITLDGGGYTIDAAFVKTNNDNNAAIGVIDTDNVTIQNLVTDVSNGTNLHGINTFESADVVITGVTLHGNGNDHSGIVVNGSSVLVTDVTTTNSGWHAINVAQGSGVITPSELTITNTSVHAEVSTPHIYIDNIAQDATVDDVDAQYDFVEFPNPGNIALTARAYFLKPFEPTGEILEPTTGEVVSGMTDLVATYDDGDALDDDAVNWAVRPYSAGCNGGGNLFGGGPLVSGIVYPSPFTFDGKDFISSIDTSLVADGNYCFVFNPTDDAGQNDVREVVKFEVDNNPVEKNECKKGGWEDFGFKNQGQCVRFVETGKDSR